MEDITTQVVDLRRQTGGEAYVLNLGANNDSGLVEVWVDPANRAGDGNAVANIRLSPAEARALAFELLASANEVDNLMGRLFSTKPVGT